MTNAQAFDIIEKWARENMSGNIKTDSGPDLTRILTGVGANVGEFERFMPRRPKKK